MLSGLLLTWVLPVVAEVEILDPIEALFICNSGVLTDTCEKYSPHVKIETASLSPSEFTPTCSIMGDIELDFYNSTGNKVDQVIIEGVKSGLRLTEEVSVNPGESASVAFSSSSMFCKGENKEKKLKAYTKYEVPLVSKCIKKMSESLIKRYKDYCAEIHEEEEARLELSAEKILIYNNCVIDKSKGLEGTAIREVRFLCQHIAKNPSAWQRWWWGN